MNVFSCWPEDVGGQSPGGCGGATATQPSYTDGHLQPPAQQPPVAWFDNSQMASYFDCPMEDKKVSVCLPVYNGTKYLSHAIESILAQTHTNWELLIADDCSSDDSAAIAKKYANSDLRIKFWTNKANAGLFANYNICMERATGAYIKTFAQDDAFEPTCLERLVNALEETPSATLVTAARIVIDENSKPIATERFFEKTTLFAGIDAITDYVRTFKYRTGTPSQVMFRRAYMGTGYDTSYYLSGDIEFHYRIIENGSYLYLDEPLVHFRRHAESATVSLLKDMSFVSDSFKLLDKYRYLLKDENGKTPLVHGPLMNSLIAKVNNAICERKIEYEEAVIHGQSNASEQLNFEFAAYQILLYAAQLNLELDSLKAEKRDRDESAQKLSQKLDALQQERAQLSQRTASLESSIKQLYSSQSWRITEPFRRIKKSLRPS